MSMMTFRLAVLLCVVVALAQLGSAYHKCEDIKDNALAEVDEEWYFESVKAGMYFVEQGNWNHFKDKTHWKWPKKFGKGRAAGSLRDICYHWDSHIVTGPALVPVKCQYTNINHQECEGDFTGTAAHGVMEAGGQVKILKTDNKSYIAGTFCIFGSKATYWILTTTDEQLDPKIVADLGKHFKNIGFDKGQTSAKKGITSLYLNKLLSVDC